jgi:hypothetical protein
VSYCAWSSDDYQSDVFVYENDGGWITHVAGARRQFAEPLPEPVSDDNVMAWMARHAKVSEIVDRSPLVPIGLPHDSETFTDASPAECAERLRELRRIGYHVPQYAIDDLESEAAEEPTHE